MVESTVYDANAVLKGTHVNNSKRRQQKNQLKKVDGLGIQATQANSKDNLISEDYTTMTPCNETEDRRSKVAVFQVGQACH